MPRGRPKKNISVLKKESTKIIEVKEQKKRGRKKKYKEPKVKVRDLQIDYYTWDQLQKMKYVSLAPQKYSMQNFKFPYFKKLPDNLVVTKETPEGTKLWSAKDIFAERGKDVYFLHRHRDIDLAAGIHSPLLEAVDGDNIKRIFGYEQVCIIPATHKASQQQSLDTVLENVKEAKRQAKIERNKKKGKKS